MQRISRSIMILLAMTFSGQYIFAQATGSLALRGAVHKPGQWSPQDVKQRFVDQIQSIKFNTGRDKAQHVGIGIPLISLLQEASPKTEKAPKHYDLTFLVIIEAHDGYRVFFSLAELLPACAFPQAGSSSASEKKTRYPSWASIMTRKVRS